MCSNSSVYSASSEEFWLWLPRFWPMRHWLGGYGILIMILGPILIRLMYELLMMAILMLKNVISINNKLRNQNGNEEKDSVFAAPDMSGLRQQIQAKAAQHQSRQNPQNPQSTQYPQQPSHVQNTQYPQNAQNVQNVQNAQKPQSAPVFRFCSKCGSPLDENGKCHNCDNGLPEA